MMLCHTSCHVVVLNIGSSSYWIRFTSLCSPKMFCCGINIAGMWLLWSVGRHAGGCCSISAAGQRDAAAWCEYRVRVKWSAPGGCLHYGKCDPYSIGEKAVRVGAIYRSDFRPSLPVLLMPTGRVTNCNHRTTGCCNHHKCELVSKYLDGNYMTMWVLG